MSVLTFYPKHFQTETVEPDHWLRVRALHVEMKAIHLLEIQSVRMNEPKGNKCRERRAKGVFLEGKWCVKAEENSLLGTGRDLEHAVCHRKCRRRGLKQDEDGWGCEILQIGWTGGRGRLGSTHM